MFAADRDLYRVLFSMAQPASDSVGGAVADVEHERAGGLAHLARRLAEDGVLREDVTVDEALDVLWVLASFESFDLLFTGRGLPLDRAVELLVTTAERTLLREPADGE
jgi:hypothetical protein